MDIISLTLIPTLIVALISLIALFVVELIVSKLTHESFKLNTDVVFIWGAVGVTGRVILGEILESFFKLFKSNYLINGIIYYLLWVGLFFLVDRFRKSRYG